MRIPAPIYRAIIGHCLDEADRDEPREACGVLAVPVARGSIAPTHRAYEETVWYPMLNVHEHPRVRFQFDPDQQVALWRGLDRLSLRPRIIYHSHLDTPPEMSEEDLRYANDVSLRHLVVSLTARTSRLWHVIEDVAFQVPLAISDGTISTPAEFD